MKKLTKIFHNLGCKTPRRGFTLVEVMVTSAVVGVAGLIGTEVVGQVMKMWKLSQARAEVQRESRTILGLVERRVRQASADSVSVGREDAAQPPYSKLTFTHISGDLYEFYQKGDKAMLRKTPLSAPPLEILLANDLRYFAFSFSSSVKDKLVNVAVCFEKPTFSGNTKDFYMSLQKIQVQNE